MAETVTIKVPDIGDFDAVEIIEVLVKAGDTVRIDDPLITLESDKATMDVPADQAGVVKELLVATGDQISEGNDILVLEPMTETAAKPAKEATAETPEISESGRKAAEAAEKADKPATPPAAAPAPVPAPPVAPQEAPAKGMPHASPSVRRFARELGATLADISGSGRKGRITREDVQAHIRGRMQAKAAAGSEGLSLPKIEAQDFSQFGAVEFADLPRIKKISGPHLHRAWLNIPHVTYHEEADITDMEALRKCMKGHAEKRGARLTPLAFIVKAVVHTLQAFPEFNSSLSADGNQLIMKKYFHIGIAVDTPKGLMVPVIRHADQKGIIELAVEMGEISQRARDGKLTAADLQGGSFTVSSLGSIGGTAFTPIINAPEVCILGVTRAAMKPVWDGSEFQPRLMLPLDISYDHRVIDGAQGARFASHLAGLLADVSRLL